jgi:hypothetical protein
MLLGLAAHGETFLGSTTATNRLVVPTNSAIIITATFGDFTNSTQVQIGGGTPFSKAISHLWEVERYTLWLGPRN